MSQPAGALSEQAIQRLREQAALRHNLSDLIGRHTNLRRAGGELVGLCLFHDERTPSLRVNDARGQYHCFGCGASGDMIQFVMDHEKVGFIDALKRLADADLPEVDPAVRRKAARENAAAREEAIAEARAIWATGVAPEGNPAEVYVRSRGITCPLPSSIRFAETYAWRDRETGEVGPTLPALIGAVVDASGQITGLQRIFLRDGGAGKARMRKPKKSLGRVRGGALRLGPPDEEIVICEGPEDGLTLAQELPGSSVWVGLGTAMMPEMELPPIVRRVVLAGDNNAAGRMAVMKAAEAIAARGISVRTMFPAPGFADFNDQLRGISA